jgi:hypothetical protein
LPSSGSFAAIDFLRKSFCATNALRPPVPVALPAMTAAVAMHTGHMGFSGLNASGLSPGLKVRVVLDDSVA